MVKTLKEEVTLNNFRVCELCNHEFKFTPVYMEDMPDRLPLSVFLVGFFKKIFRFTLMMVTKLLAICLWTAAWIGAIPFIAGISFNFYFFDSKTVVEDYLIGLGLCLLVGLMIPFIVLLHDYISRENLFPQSVNDRQRAHDLLQTASQRLERQRLRAEFELREQRERGTSLRDFRDNVPTEVNTGRIVWDAGVEAHSDDDNVSLSAISITSTTSQIDPRQRLRALARRRAERIRLRTAGNISPIRSRSSLGFDDTFEISTRLTSAPARMRSDQEEFDRQWHTGVNNESNENPRTVNTEVEVDVEGEADAEEEIAEEEDRPDFIDRLFNGNGILNLQYDIVFQVLTQTSIIALVILVAMHLFVVIPFFLGGVCVKLVQTILPKLFILLEDMSPNIHAELTSLKLANFVSVNPDSFLFKLAIGLISMKGLLFIITQILGTRFSQNIEKVFFSIKSFFKIFCVLGIELLIFPEFCGTLIKSVAHYTLNSCLPDFEMNLVDFLTNWVIGTAFMFSFASFVQILRHKFRPGVLYFIRNPNDTTYHPIKDMIRLSILKQILRIIKSALIYLVIIGVSTFFTAQLVVQSDILPFRTTWGLKMSIDLILANQIIVPLMFRFFKPKPLFQAIIHQFINAASSVLGVNSFLLGTIESHESGYQFCPNTDKFYSEFTQQLPNQTDINNHLYQKNEPSSNSNLYSEYCVVWKPKLFRLRMLVFTFALWAYLILNIGSLFIGNILFGRFLSFKLGIRVKNDVYAFALSVFLFSIAFKVLRRIGEYRHPRQLLVLLFNFCKIFYCFFFFAGVWPLCLGFLTETLLRSVTGVELVAVYWLLGMIQLRLLTFVLFLTGGRLHEAVQRFSDRGIWNIDLKQSTLDLILPVTLHLVFACFFPPLLGIAIRLYDESLVEKESIHLFGLTVIGMTALLGYGIEGLVKLWQIIKDDAYLVGIKLRNNPRIDTQVQDE